MQVRHRIGQGNGPNGYRSNAMGGSRISPDGSMRDHQLYNPERRSYRGGYARGGGGGSHSRPFHPTPHHQPPPQHMPPHHPPRENDVFMEAGRLAAAYLVSKGVLPPNALSGGKWRNDSSIMPQLVRRNYSDERGRRKITGSFKNYESGAKRQLKCNSVEESDADVETIKGSDEEEGRIGNYSEQNDEENKEEGNLVRVDNVDSSKEVENVPTEVPTEHDNDSVMERGEKRVLDDVADCREGTSKRPKENVASIDVQSDGCLPLSNSLENRTNISFFPEDNAESSKLVQEKTYDLDLIGAFDVNESQNNDVASVIISPSVAETNKNDATPVDVDLSMNYNFNMPKNNGKRGIIKDAEIEVIDLDNDSGQEDQIFGSPERRGDAVFTDLDGFPNNAHNPDENPDSQDGYGLMISELLGKDNEVGIPGDDDSIYMSLGEIPISFLRAWEQPTQDYGKPF
ncbi:hypothetical protein MIMGU_mgv1a006125mg [Erythranthe guttata]|uniref:Uncharacterized protein n=1 Tax=Erythranthe guttata TaxID=4155 RepID=A0A022R1B1_ERYGU|nr:hypothetical protein MIMGU_mgv1a006125mg [Erythranthe guttata]